MATKPDSTKYTPFLEEYDWDNLAQRVEDIYTTKHLSKTISKEVLTPVEAYAGTQETYTHEEVLVGGCKPGREE